LAVLAILSSSPGQESAAGSAGEPASAAVVDELARHALPLATVDPDKGFADLEPLKELIGGARIVTLGEAAPGTRELFHVNRRLVEFLVAEMDFSVLAIEANWPESRALDEYVLHGTGDPRAALAGLRAPAWNNAEALALVQWLRQWNADEKHSRKVKLQGFDMQYTRLAYQNVQDYLQKVDEESAERMGIVLAAFRQEGPDGRPRYASLGPEMKDASHSAIQDTLALLEDSKEIYLKRASAAEWQIAKESAVILSEAEEMMRTGAGMEAAGFREKSMAANIGRILAREPSGTRLVVWARDAHVRDEKEPAPRRMGSYLREKFGRDDWILGSTFDQGSIPAEDGGAGGKDSKAAPEIRVGPAPADSVEAALARTKLPLAIFAFARMPKDGPAAKWLDAPRAMREMDAAHTGEQGLPVQVTPARAYDGLIFVARTTSAQPLPSVEAKVK
jgi:erythromycin esterase